MAKKKKNKEKSKFRQRIKHHYRLVIMSDDSLEEQFSLKLSILNVFVLGSLGAILLITLTSVLIAFTPIKEYIPGYSSTELKKTASQFQYKTDSLEQTIAINKAYIESVKAILIGDIKIDEINKDSIIKQITVDELSLKASATDSILRLEVDQKDRFSVFEKATKKDEVVFFAPVKGSVTDPYNLENKHYAVDIVVADGTPVKAIADGSIIFSGFTANTGYVIILEHLQGFLSVYKHNKFLYKEQGELVKSGEVIANSGSTGNLTTGPHLHFELWNDGFAVNPTDYIDFE